MRTHKIILLTLGLIAVTGIALWITHQRPAPAPAAPHTAETETPATPPSRPLEQPSVAEPTSPASRENEAGPAALAQASSPAPAPELKPVIDEAFEQTVNQLVSPQLSFLQKQAIWGQIRNADQVGRVIAALEQRMAADPTSAEIPAELGMAYLLGIASNPDVREQGIGGMKADMSFDAALKLDPSNWEAGFLKASALSHWPESMKRGPEVIQRFTALIDLQEAQPARPEFVQSYVLLGEQYQKSGQPDDARQVWARGLALFPGSQTLAQRLNPSP